MDHIKVIRLSFVNAFLLKAGDSFILIDTGLSMHGETLRNELAAAGCLPGKLSLIIITHGDIDHIGNCVMLRREYGCRIAMNAGDVPMVRDGITYKRKTRSMQSRFFSVIRKMLRKKFEFEKFSPDILLADGDSLTGFGLDAMVIHLPGHTRGSIGVLTNDGSFFSGDTFLNRSKPGPANLIENEESLQNSYKRIRSLPIKMIYPGHGSPFAIDEIAGKF
ncbi:MAG TPA: MBL fold metallo-hydrolase [Bacteroidales bacterium]|nr:MBL fold metallo-hydrolase [Bacteroidales bacterium]